MLEFTPGLGSTARLKLERGPRSGMGVESEAVAEVAWSYLQWSAATVCRWKRGGDGAGGGVCERGLRGGDGYDVADTAESGPTAKTNSTDGSNMALFRKNKPETVSLRSGDKAPNFQLPSVQGGLFRLDMRTAHGPVVLAFVDAGEESRELLEHLKQHEVEFQRAGEHNYYHPNPEIRTTGRPHSSIGPTVAATVVVVVRAETMEPVRGMQERLELPYYVLWDEAGRVCGKYGVAEGEVATALVESDGTLTWFLEFVESLRVEQILRVILPVQDENSGPET